MLGLGLFIRPMNPSKTGGDQRNPPADAFIVDHPPVVTPNWAEEVHGELIRMARLIPLLLMVALFAATGCTSNIKFPLGTPYPTPHKIEEGVVVSFPDSIVKRRFSAKVGSFLDQHVYRVSVYDAYRTETVARMNGLFTDGVTLVVHSALQEIQDEQVSGVMSDEQRAAAGDESTESRLDQILADLEAKESGDKTVKKRQDELVEEALREAAKETIDQKNSVYLLKFRDALYGMSDGRVAVTFSIRFIDRRTGAILLEKRYKGLSPRFEPGNNQKTNEVRFLALTKQAFSGAMSTMVKDIAEVTGH